MLTEMKSSMLCSVAKDWSKNYKFSTLITNETIVVKRFPFAFLVLVLPRLKKEFIGMHVASRTHAVQLFGVDALILHYTS